VSVLQASARDRRAEGCQVHGTPLGEVPGEAAGFRHTMLWDLGLIKLW